jgi:Asp/Glu/hydantoin racemase
MQPIIFVINPNSTQAVTDAIDQAVAPLRLSDGPQIRCLTLEQGPPGVQTQLDADSVIMPLVNLVRALDQEHGKAVSAYVIACFSDPGLHAVREATERPVLGISECGILTAMTLGHRIGVIAILRGALPRHARLFAAMGVSSRIAAELPIGMSVLELADAHKTRQALKTVGQTLRDQHLADVIVLGCAGMAEHRSWLEQELGIPVVEPSQAATAMALGRSRLGW